MGLATGPSARIRNQRIRDRRHVEVVFDQLGDARVAVVEARKHGGCEGPSLAQCLVARPARERAFNTSGRVGLVGIPERYLLGRSTPTGARVDTSFHKIFGRLVLGCTEAEYCD